MVFDSFESIFSLLCTIVGTLFCVFKYIENPKRVYKLLVVYFLSNFLSEYYWTNYILVMHRYPDVSMFIAYLGWNIGFLFLLISVLSLRFEGSKWYFHPLMLLPVFFTVPQFLLFIQYGGLMNNIWEVGVTTLTMVFCLQQLIYYRKNKDRVKVFPYLSLLVFVYLILEYGSWTATCFSWPSELISPYFYCSLADALICTFFAYAAQKSQKIDLKNYEAKSAAELRLQAMMQVMLSIIIIAISIIGFFIALWIKKAMTKADGVFWNERILLLALFAISISLIILILVLLRLLTRQYLHLLEKITKKNEGKRNRSYFYFTITLTLALMVFSLVYNSMIFHEASISSVYEDGEEEIKTISTEIENHLEKYITTLRVVSDTVVLMKRNGNAPEEIEKFLVDQTSLMAKDFDVNFTGLYAYIDGKYMDGLEWVPPEGYDPTKREWYSSALAKNGEITIISPYVDAQTGLFVITVAKSISDTDVVCLDVIINHIKESVQELNIHDKGYGMLVNEDGFIIAHKDEVFDGKNLVEEYGQKLMDTILSVKSGRTSAMVADEDCTLFISPVAGQWYSVIVVDNAELFDDTYSQLAFNIIVTIIAFSLITLFTYINYKNEKIYARRVEEMNLQVVMSLASAIDAKDNYTNGHSARVAKYSRMIAARFGYSTEAQDEIYMMGLLHDIGKIGVPDSVINKPTRLTLEEFELIKKHPVIGDSILKSIKENPKLCIAARWHHERYDGKGYPDGLSGEQIPEEARIIAVADAYDAMTSRRSYRDVLSQDKVRSEIERCIGTQFDPTFASIMLILIDEDKDFLLREK